MNRRTYLPKDQLCRAFSLVVTIVLLALAAHLASRLINPWIPRALRWIPLYASAAGFAWVGVGGVPASIGAMLGAGLGATSPLLPISTLVVLMPMPLLRGVMFVLQFFGPPLLAGLGGGLATVSVQSSSLRRSWARRSGLTGPFSAGFVAGAAGTLSWVGVVILEEFGIPGMGRALAFQLAMVTVIGMAGGLAGVAGTRLGQHLRRGSQLT